MFAAQIQKVLKEAQPVTPSREEETQRYDEVQIGAALQSMGIQIGDKVVVGGVKVCDHRKWQIQDFYDGDGGAKVRGVKLFLAELLKFGLKSATPLNQPISSKI